MKLTIDREKLNKGLQVISKTISNRPSLPILSNVLLSTEDSGLKLTATDLDLGITTWLPARVENEGAFTLPARLLTEFVSNNTDESLEIKVLDNVKAEVKSQKFQAIISGIASDEFPNIPEVQANLEMVVSAESFIKAIRQTVIACALDDVRPALSGVLCKFNEQKLIIVATDSFRLGEYIIDLESETPTKEIIIPARTTHEVIRIHSLTPEEKINLKIGDNQACFTIGQTKIISRLIEATFPAYEKIIPHETSCDLTVSTNELQVALRASRIFAATGSNNVKLAVKDQEIIITSLASERGESIIKVNGSIVKHDQELEIIVAYNARYLTDAINACEDEQVVLFITGEKKPTIVRSPNNPSYQHLVMPVDIKE